MPFIEAAIARLPEYGLAIGKNEITSSEVVEEEWATAWKKYYHPVRITRYLTIVPSWEQYENDGPCRENHYARSRNGFRNWYPSDDALDVTGVRNVFTSEETVLDVGTGSGVLSIASRHLGANQVYAYDLDEVAVRAAKENMALNSVAEAVNVAANDLLTGIEIESDIIVANILADIILLMIPDAWRLLKLPEH